MNSRSILQNLILLVAVGLLAGCGLFADPPVVDEILAEPSTTKIETGKTVTLRINAQGTDIKFEWTVDRGMLSNDSKSAVVYTAPDSPGPDIVTVKVKTKGGEVTKGISFDVVEPPPPTATETPLPADTPTSTAAPEPTVPPEPISCIHPAVTQNLFPQLADENGQFPIYGPETETKFLCEAVYDIVHTLGGMAVHVKYENVEKNFGWWGVATPNGYDASQHSQVCFWAYAQEPNQSFRLKMKDTSRNEDGIKIIVGKQNLWEQICTDISTFADLDIHVDKMDNVNLGFEQPTDSAEIWIADFEFVD